MVVISFDVKSLGDDLPGLSPYMTQLGKASGERKRGVRNGQWGALAMGHCTELQD